MTSLVNRRKALTGDGVNRTSNNFGAVRLGLAFLVVYAHSVTLAKGVQFKVLGHSTHHQMELGTAAVYGFMVISGFLVTQSWFRSGSAGGFLLKRFRRIYPAYWAALFFSLVVGCVFSSPNALAYLRLTAFSSELVMTALMLPEFNLVEHPLAFASNPIAGAVNGSLWTLRFELFCYALLLVAGLAGLLSWRWGILAMLVCNYVLFAGYLFWFVAIPPPALQLTLYFFCGAAAARFWPRLPRPTLLRCALIAGLLVAAARTPPALILTAPLLGGYLILALACAPLVVLPRTFERLDLSYGVYLFAFPIQQAIVAATGTDKPFVVLGICTPLVLPIALASWKFIEAPALDRLRKNAGANAVAEAIPLPLEHKTLTERKHSA